MLYGISLGSRQCFVLKDEIEKKSFKEKEDKEFKWS